jgi:hypothetical protein
MWYSLFMIRICFIKEISVFSFFACSTALANPAIYLKCYNEIHAPSTPVHAFGVPVPEPESGLKSNSLIYSRFRQPSSASAYLVTSKTILKKTFDYSTAKIIGNEPNPTGAGQVQISASPIFEIDSLYTGELTKVYIRALWSSTLDHPNGADLSIVEETRGKVYTRTNDSQDDKIINAHLTPESRDRVIQYLKSQIGRAVSVKQGSAMAYDACHSIPELKNYMESKMNLFKTDSNSKLPIPTATTPAATR